MEAVKLSAQNLDMYKPLVMILIAMRHYTRARALFNDIMRNSRDLDKAWVHGVVQEIGKKEVSLGIW